MRVVIDVRPALRRSTGVGRYVSGLVRGLARLEPPPEIVVFSTSLSDRFAPGHWPPSVRLAERRWPAKGLDLCWRLLRWPRLESLAGSADLAHSPSPLRVPTAHPCIITLHDLFLKHPELVDGGHGRNFVRRIARELTAAHATIAVSEYTRGEAVRLLGLDGESIHVIHSGLERHWFEPLEPADRLSRMGRLNLDDNFVLAVGRPEPRKNMAVALGAVARLRRPGLRLVVAGPVGPVSNRLARRASRLGVELRMLGHVRDEDLKALYQTARALVFPSLDEGFGFPVLEAMALGLPVVASSAGALPEVAGEAAAFAPPEDEQAFADRLAEVLDDPGRAEELRGRGRRRAERFSWDVTARRTNALYERVLGS